MNFFTGTYAECFPGLPSCVSFPEVAHSTARIIWNPPAEQNGIITDYWVSYRQKSAPPSFVIVDDKLGPTRREFEVTGLSRMTYYVFSVTDSTDLGWGVAATAEVYTIVNRRPPDPPTKPETSQIGDRWVTIAWRPGG
ncbi:hypothetical protein LSAT2_007292 [Lamellibrachia satsuma]|nr:hypothetical protein LSAT2_007292 [Lamellibrachia satsuma]